MSAASQTDPIRVSPFVLTWPRLLGISLEEIAAASRIPLTTLRAATSFSYDETMSIWAALEHVSGDPVAGLHAGARFTIDQMGVVGPAIAHATHLDAGLDALARIMGSFARNAGIRRIDSDLGAGLEYQMPSLRSRHGVDTVFAATLALMRQCTDAGDRSPLIPLALDHQMPRVVEAEYRRFYGVTPRWDQPASRLWFRRADLSRPFRGAEPLLAELLSENASRLLAPQTTSPSFAQELERAFWISHATPTGATLESTAEALGVKARTLQRRFQDAGTSFAKERDKLLHRRACDLLRESQLTIDAIGERLGYSSRAAFDRAFFRWAGQTPHAARATRP